MCRSFRKVLRRMSKKWLAIAVALTMLAMLLAMAKLLKHDTVRVEGDISDPQSVAHSLWRVIPSKVSGRFGCRRACKRVVTQQAPNRAGPARCSAARSPAAA